MGYAITSNGLEKTGKCELKAGYIYFMGASSHPTTILVTSVDEKSAHYISLHQAEWGHTNAEHTYDTPRREQSWILQSLVSDAKKTIWKQYDQAMSKDLSRDPFAKFAIQTMRDRITYVDGKAYEFEQRTICNCCGDDADVIDGKSSCCQQDCRQNRDASIFIGQ